MRAWLTQDSIPSTRIEYVLTLPNSWEWRAQFLGAFLLLTQPENWEEYGVLSPQEMADEWLELFLLFESEGMNLIPVGTIMAYAGDTPPLGFFMCDFSEFNRDDFSELFAVIGVRYGVGNGTTTANLPDLRGRVVVGFDVTDADFNSLGDFGGQKNVTLEVSEIPAHTHIQDAHTHTQNAHTHIQDAHLHTQTWFNQPGGAGPFWDGGGATWKPVAAGANTGPTTPTNQNATPTNQNATPTNQNTTPTNQNTTPTSQNAGGGEAHNNLQPYWVMNYIIKY